MVDITNDGIVEPVIKAPCDLKGVFTGKCSARELLVQNTDFGRKLGGYAEIDADTVNNGRRIAPQTNGPGAGPS